MFKKVRCAFFILGIGLSVMGIAGDWLEIGSTPGFGIAQITAVVIGSALIFACLMIRDVTDLYLLFVITAVSYICFEAAVNVLFRTGVVTSTTSVSFYENSDRTFHFEPVRGFRLTQTPSRRARISEGIIEFSEVIKGNNQGFADQHDFYPQRPDSVDKRLLILGDSFTAAQYIKVNWPDRIEDIYRTDGRNVQLLNFSLPGIGLANWWSILINLIEAEGYEADGLVIAVYPSDLLRTFTVTDHRDRHIVPWGRLESWNPATYPKTLAEARPYFIDSAGYIVSSDEFDRIISGGWTSYIPIRPYVAWTFLHRWQVSRNDAVEAQSKKHIFDAGAMRLIEDMKRVVKQMDIPVAIIHIPSKTEILENLDAPV